MSDLERLIRKIVREEIANAEPANDLYLSTAVAAAFAGVSVYTIRRWVRSGELTRHGAGPRVLVHREELRKLLACEITPIDALLSPEERAVRRFG